MEKIIRTKTPDWLKKKWKEWGEAWAALYARTKKSSSFKWRKYQGKGYDDLVKELSALTRNHCSFCDAYHLGDLLEPTIEHFRPKTLFPLEAYKWENLFLCCRLCQKKGDKFDEFLLKPDEDDYSFDKYFDIDFGTGKLIPNRDATAKYLKRAKITIDYYRLNKNGKPKSRLRVLKQYKKNQNPDIDEWPYRFFITRGHL